MLAKLSYCISAILFIVRNLPTIIGLYQLVKSWPGTNDPAKLRAWVLAALKDGKILALATSNTIDDKAIDTAIMIVENDVAWGFVRNIIYRDSTLSRFIPKVDCELIADSVGDDTENPVLILNAVLLILQIVKFFKKP